MKTPPHSRSILPVFVALAMLSLAGFAHAVTTNWTGSSGTDWNTAGNWDNGIPTSLDTAVINGNYTVDVSAAAVTDLLQLGGSGSANVTLNISSTLDFDDAFGTRDWGVAGDSIAVNINSGGILNGGVPGAASRFDGFASITVNSGGAMTGIYRQRLGMDITLNGGTYTLYGTVGGVQTGTYGLDAGSILGASGTLIFAANGDGVNTRLNPPAGSTFDVDQITVALDILTGYTPLVGHAYDLVNANAASTTDLGDGSNISTTSSDGLWEFTYDLSNWNPVSAPNKGIIVLASVTSVPEPTALALVGLGSLLLVARRRRTQVA